MGHIMYIKQSTEHFELQTPYCNKKNFVKRNFYKKIKNKQVNNLVVNLSNLTLTNHDHSILNKGLKFVPTLINIKSRLHTTLALAQLRNRMSTIYYFYHNPRPQADLHRRSNWTAPQPKNNTLLKYFQSIKMDVDTFANDFNNNCSREERTSLGNLSKNSEIIIKKADKGGSIVIMNRNDYVCKVYEHLNNET